MVSLRLRCGSDAFSIDASYASTMSLVAINFSASAPEFSNLAADKMLTHKNALPHQSAVTRTAQLPCRT
jgi:hypothetical protein